MTDGPDWADTLAAVKKVPGKESKNNRLGMDQVAQWQEFQQQRTGADVAVAVGAVDTGDDFDGWGAVTEWAADQIAGFVNIWNGWFGSGGTGTPAQTQYVIESIKDAVINGYTVHTITSDEANWAVPPHTEFNVILIGGGQNGGGGGSSWGGSLAAGGSGGLNGSYIAQAVDLTGITALDTKIGTAGNKSYMRVANTTTPHTGTIIAQSPAAGSPGGIAATFGYTTTTSTPGSGGAGEGGGTGHAAGQPGVSTPAATGGAVGGNNGVYGLPGGTGGNVSAGATTKCGGAGGGGGGTAVFAFNTGGSGGAGGYPGGGGGGGGCGLNVSGAGGGPGAVGVVWYYYR